MRVPSRVALVAAALAAVSCAPPALEYPPPAQKVMPSGDDASVPMMVRISDPNVDRHVVQDVLSDQPGAAWRWTNAHPRLKVLADGAPGPMEFVVEFTVPGVVLKRTGPLHIEFVVNDRVVGSGTFGVEGKQIFRTPVKPEWLANGDQVVFGMNVDPVYVADDGAKLGILLEAIGFGQVRPR